MYNVTLKVTDLITGEKHKENFNNTACYVMSLYHGDLFLFITVLERVQLSVPILYLDIPFKQINDMKEY